MYRFQTKSCYTCRKLADIYNDYDAGIINATSLRGICLPQLMNHQTTNLLSTTASLTETHDAQMAEAVRLRLCSTAQHASTVQHAATVQCVSAYCTVRLCLLYSMPQLHSCHQPRVCGVGGEECRILSPTSGAGERGFTMPLCPPPSRSSPSMFSALLLRLLLCSPALWHCRFPLKNRWPPLHPLTLTLTHSWLRCCAVTMACCPRGRNPARTADIGAQRQAWLYVDRPDARVANDRKDGGEGVPVDGGRGSLGGSRCNHHHHHRHDTNDVHGDIRCGRVPACPRARVRPPRRKP